MSDKALHLGILVLRLWVGLNFIFAHGWGKISDPQAFLSNPALQKFPAPTVMGWAAILSEFFGGILLVLGLATRFAALAILGVMIGAATVVHATDPWNVKEVALSYAAMTLFLLLVGGGKYSLDRVLASRKRAKNPW